MTLQEAINALKQINLKRVHPFYDWEEMLEVRDIAINALEKQIPKELKDDGWLYCPICGRDVLLDRFNYCPDCGQALDWSDTALDWGDTE